MFECNVTALWGSTAQITDCQIYYHKRPAAFRWLQAFNDPKESSKNASLIYSSFVIILKYRLNYNIIITIKMLMKYFMMRLKKIKGSIFFCLCVCCETQIKEVGIHI